MLLIQRIDVLSSNSLFYKTYIETPLGIMRAIAHETGLYSLEFVDEEESREGAVTIKNQALTISAELNPVLLLIKHELSLYFDGVLKEFQTPLFINGTSFQQATWEITRTISYGTTRPYLYLASLIEKPLAVRAIAKAHAANRLTIIIPCHRIIMKNGELGGYRWGIQRKQWLLYHEKRK